MAANSIFEFNTVPECKAFMEGVRYVNESAESIRESFMFPAKAIDV